MELIIEKDIPVPRRRAGRVSKFEDLLSMKVDDSVLVENYREAASLQMFLNRNGMVGTIRKQSSGAYRVWRIA